MASPIPRRALPWVIAIWTLLKLLLIPTSVYRSTDFDVHRNWLAVTRHLPLSEWYHDDVNGTTVHTLDYPPSFAYFEALLSLNPATQLLLDRGLLDERCLAPLGDDDNDPSASCVAFQRATVVFAADAVLILGAWFASVSVLLPVGGGGGGPGGAEGRAVVAALLIVLNPGLLLLDHVHFQYNGMLLGLLLLSIGCIARGSRGDPDPMRHVSWDVCGAVLYALLLTMKHLYLILAPLYFVYLLRRQCFGNFATGKAKFDPGKFAVLAVATGSMLLLPFVPFLLQPPGAGEQLAQIFRRLFPFQRGLVHDYWAANVWALYLFADKCLRFVLRRLGSVLPPTVRSLVPEGLPDVPPSVAALCLLAGLLPACFRVWSAASSYYSANKTAVKAGGGGELFVHAVVFCSFSGFMLAYHVHEKAIMTATIPLTLLATSSRDHARLYLRTFALGHFGLLPLLFRPEELLLKVMSYILFMAFAVFALEGVTGNCVSGQASTGIVTRVDKIWLVILGSVLIFMEVVHPLYLKPRDRLEFLPLMTTSVVCAVGLVWGWVQSGRMMFGCEWHKSFSTGDASRKNI